MDDFTYTKSSAGPCIYASFNEPPVYFYVHPAILEKMKKEMGAYPCGIAGSEMVEL